MSTAQVLGEVSLPSGKVLVIDTGLLNLWSQDRPPLVTPGVLPPATEHAANSAVDLRIEGPDAEKAHRAFDRQTWSPTWIFDIPRARLDEVRELFDACVRQHGLSARLTELPERVPHRARVDRTLERARAGIVQFHGMWSIAAGGLPAQPLRVLGERMAGEEYTDRWRSVWLEVQRDSLVARSEEAGAVMVDRARLMFVDVDALGAWKHDEPIDGKADFVFWGRDAAAAARATSAPSLGDREFGWRDVPLREAVRLGTSVEECRDRQRLKFATDFRPHSHHYSVMDQIRTTPTESASLEVGGARLCAFATTWGDGCFPVFLDLDEKDRIARVRIDLGNERTVETARKLLQE